MNRWTAPPASGDHKALRTLSGWRYCTGAASGLCRSNIRSSFSWPAVKSLLPAQSREKSTVLTTCLWAHVYRSAPVIASHNFTEKSAEAVAAFVAGKFSFADHTAPLWPANVPIQSPVSPLRSIGFLSRQALMRKMPSGVGAL